MPGCFWKWGAALAAVLALAACERSSTELDHVGRPVNAAEFSGPENNIKAGLPGARDEVNLVRLRDGSIGYVVRRLGAGTDRLLTPDEFAQLVYDARSGRGWFERLLNITSPAGIAWVSLGLLGQLIFTGRMLVQWLASEKSGRSVIPVAFWWMSLGGAVMLVVYFIWRRDIVGVVGQGTGLFIYARNLVLIRRSRGA
ncbi:MAG: lipid-A-disaccharide synthase N-terminal domain-containing protein [Terrimicrobiaceae bacterium]|nr:lipid-A-disaccharide synthase N-terminal domain-containing protein [Terrimicrobiaceae bacterium]